MWIVLQGGGRLMILYSNDCPRCKVIKQMLKKYKYDFTEVDNKQKILDLGFTMYPVVEMDGAFYSYSGFLTYLKESANADKN